ncbi:MAG: glutathione S-transferase [Rickettsiales bacterium]|nr:glutathione S-transferase [Rickettsiales bacterium]|tara:strand:+ start:719 stop:1186 length:468 start_codon:yes stop_codon:yes gene_type:complete
MENITFTMPIITTFYASLLALLIFPMVILIIKRRLSSKIGLGMGRHDGLRDEQQLLKAVRIHGNYIEFVPIMLLLFALIEMIGADPYLMHGLGILLLAARISHGLGLYDSAMRTAKRTFGVLATLLCLAITIGTGLYLSAPYAIDQITTMVQSSL